jgi:Tol biopolymer transport system component
MARFGVALAALACGARTGLYVPEGDAAIDAPIGAGCSKSPWLLFDVSDHGPQLGFGLYAMRADGSELHPVPLPHGPGVFPSVSPDGTKLLYATFQPPDAGLPNGDDSALYAYDFASRTASLVLTTQGLTYSALSPDGRTVAYVSGYDLHDAASDGSRDRTLRSGPDPNSGTGFGHPTFAADSRTILYGAGGFVGAIGVDGTGDETLLSIIPGSFQYPNPAFSPDYSQIAVGALCQNNEYALRVYSFASLPGATCESGRLLTDVNFGASFNLANDPSWGVNGLIAYESSPDVYVIAASGGTPTDLTASLTGDAGTVTAQDPVWAPACAEIP